MYYCVIMLMILIMMVMMAINLQICNCSPVQNHPLHMKQQRISFTFLFHSNTCQTSELVSSLINIPLPLRLEQNYQDDPRPALLSPCLAEAQAILRQMIREAEDPDKDLREELQGEEDEKHKKMRSKGRGRGRGGGKGKGRSRGGGKGRSRGRGAGGKKVVDQNDQNDAVEEKDEPAPPAGEGDAAETPGVEEEKDEPAPPAGEDDASQLAGEGRKRPQPRLVRKHSRPLKRLKALSPSSSCKKRKRQPKNDDEPAPKNEATADSDVEVVAIPTTQQTRSKKRKTGKNNTKKKSMNESKEEEQEAVDLDKTSPPNEEDAQPQAPGEDAAVLPSPCVAEPDQERTSKDTKGKKRMQTQEEKAALYEAAKDYIHYGSVI